MVLRDDAFIMPKKSKNTSHKDALPIEVQHEMEQARTAASNRIRDCDETAHLRSVTEIAIENNWLAFLRPEADEISAASKKK